MTYRVSIKICDSERTRKVGVYILYNLACASVQPDTDEVRSGLHSPYLRHLPEKKKKTRTNRIFLGRWWSVETEKRIKGNRAISR